MLRIETALAVLAITLTLFWPTLGARWFDNIERFFFRLAHRKALAVAGIGVAALLMRLAILPVEPIPEPIVHDEFGYLLAADTFAHGRLTNPTHPMWVHFESFNILQKPTYQCITPPMQGLILAFGKTVFGHPFWGVWLSAGIMCAAITWMLQAWVPPTWALAGGFLSIIRYGVWTYWADSYWGGTAGAIGGALLLGALPRIKRDCRARDAVIMAVGLTILANTRPYDGFIFSLPVLIVLSVWMFGKQPLSLRVRFLRVLAPLLVIMTLTGIGTGYYFWRVTGSPFRMPYQIERETYGAAPYLLWQRLPLEPKYNHPVLRKMYVDAEMVSYRTFKTPIGVGLKAYIGWRFYLGPLLTLSLLALIFTLPFGFSWSQISGPTMFLVLVLSCVIAGALSESFFVGAHYCSPVTCVVLALTVTALQSVRQSGLRGLFLTRAFVLCATIFFVLRSLAAPLHLPLAKSIMTGLYERTATDFGRSTIEKQLETLPDKHLVIVHYRPDHEPFDEWVYNRADIDNSKIVWAREMDFSENARLLEYFKDRHTWFLDADSYPLTLSSYPFAARTAPGAPPPNSSTAAVK